jgi:hypothetical protein
MIIYLDKKFNIVDKKKAVIAKVIPPGGAPRYFIVVNKKSNK